MRIRIVKAVRGDLDGIPLASFQVGQTYDVSPSLATYLILESCAQPVMDDERAVEIPIEEERYAVPDQTEPPAIAADATDPAQARDDKKSE